MMQLRDKCSLTLGNAPGGCLYHQGALRLRLQLFSEYFRRKDPNHEITLGVGEVGVVQVPFNKRR